MSNENNQSKNYSKGQYNRNTTHTTNAKEFVYTCWRCNKTFTSPTKLQSDTVKCPFCKMIHGHITSP